MEKRTIIGYTFNSLEGENPQTPNPPQNKPQTRQRKTSLRCWRNRRVLETKGREWSQCKRLQRGKSGWA